jgi:hypothetical protein
MSVRFGEEYKSRIWSVSVDKEAKKITVCYQVFSSKELEDSEALMLEDVLPREKRTFSLSDDFMGNAEKTCDYVWQYAYNLLKDFNSGVLDVN